MGRYKYVDVNEGGNSLRSGLSCGCMHQDDKYISANSSDSYQSVCTERLQTTTHDTVHDSWA